MENLFGETIADTTTGEGQGEGLCACGCGGKVEWKGYGRRPKYISNAHGERARRRNRNAMTIRVRDDISRQTCQELLDWITDPTEQSTYLNDTYYLQKMALRFLINSPAPVKETLEALAIALSWVP